MDVSAEAVMSILAAEAGLDEAKLRPEATLAELDIGSIDVASALFALEDQFGVEVDPEDISPSMTLAAFADHVKALAAR